MADRMVRCPEGHFYDANKHSACPWCAPPLDITPNDAQKTRAIPQMGAVTPPTLPLTPPAAGDAETRRYGQSPKGMDPVVGWLVCLDGPDRGRDFRLKMERNFIGRAPSMDICLVNDERISRERHASITFDPKNKGFWLTPGDSTGLVYLNGTLVHSPALMKADDVIDLGSSKLVLIPFCGEKYEWA